MLGDVTIQLDNERFRRLYSGVLFSIIEETGQALLYAGTEENPEEILVLERIGVNLNSDEDIIQVSGFAPDGKDSFNRCSLEFWPYSLQDKNEAPA